MEGAFNFCEELRAVSLPAGLARIGDMSFAACYRLEKISIPDSVTEIGEGAFRFCNSLRRVELPAAWQSPEGQKMLANAGVPESVRHYR